MCGFNSGYHDVNLCYFGRTMVNFNKTQNSQKNKISPYEKRRFTIQITICVRGGPHEKKVENHWCLIYTHSNFTDII